MELLEILDKYPAYKLNKYTHSFANGTVLESMYGCSICTDSGWTTEEFGVTPFEAVYRALDLIGAKDDEII